MNGASKGGAIVTGAASGIGRAIAEALSKEGFSLLIADIDKESGSKASNEISSTTGGPTAFAHTDVTERVQLRKAVVQCREEFAGNLPKPRSKSEQRRIMTLSAPYVAARRSRARGR